MRRRLIIGGVLLVTLLVGVGIGGSGKKKAAASTKTVTVTQTKTVTTAGKTVTTDAKVAVPAGCLDAITSARLIGSTAGDAFGIYAQYSTIAVQAIKAAAAQDGATLEELTPKVVSLNAKIDGDTGAMKKEVTAFNTFAANCK